MRNHLIRFIIASGLIYLLIQNIAEANIEYPPAYKRSLYMFSWDDEDKDCQNTRTEVLLRESLTPPVLDTTGCMVVSGKWYDPYTDKYYYDPRMLDIDHVVPLKEVHVSGGYIWSKDKKRSYANNLTSKDILIPVYRGINRSKGSKDPAHWLPPNRNYRCMYIFKWIDIKAEWGLYSDELETKRVAEMLSKCR
jgi:hypothetical protein